MNNFSDPRLQGIFDLFVLVLARLLKLPEKREDIPFLNIYEAPGDEREDDWEAHVSKNKGRAWIITPLYPKGRERTLRTTSKGRRWESKEGRHIDPRHKRLQREEASYIPEGLFWMRDKFILEPASDGTKYTMFEYTFNKKKVSHNNETQKTGGGPLWLENYALCQIVADKKFGDEGPSSSSELPNNGLNDDINSSNNQLDQKMPGAISKKHTTAATIHKLTKRHRTETTEASTSRQQQEQVQVQVQNEFETTLPIINGNGLTFGHQTEITCVVPSNYNVSDDRVGTYNHLTSQSDPMYGPITCLEEPNNLPFNSNWNSTEQLENNYENINTACRSTIDCATLSATVDPLQCNFFQGPELESLPLLESVEDGNLKFLSAAGPNTSNLFSNESANVYLNPENASWLEILAKALQQDDSQGSLDLDWQSRIESSCRQPRP